MYVEVNVIDQKSGGKHQCFASHVRILRKLNHIMVQRDSGLSSLSQAPMNRASATRDGSHIENVISGDLQAVALYGHHLASLSVQQQKSGVAASVNLLYHSKRPAAVADYLHAAERVLAAAVAAEAHVGELRSSQHQTLPVGGVLNA